MKKLINNLESLKASLNQNEILQHYMNGRLNKTFCTFNPPATLSEIDQTAKRNDWIFPADYKQFLQWCNGAYLFDDEYGSGVEFLSLQKVEEYHLDYMPSNWIPIAYIIGDYLFIDSNQANNKTGYLMFHNHEQRFEVPTIRFTIDLSTWLERLIITRGAPFWDWEN